MKLSLIVPVYNIEKYIPTCIDSLIGQINEDVELIIVNDGSTDSSGEIAEKTISDIPFCKVIHKKNGGLGSARNAGLKEAVGEFVWFIDGDDEIVPNAVKNLLLTIQKLGDSDLINFYTYHIRLNETEKRLESIMQGFQKVNVNYFLANVHSIPVAVWLFLFRRKFIVENNLQFDDNMIFEDEHFILQAYNLATNVSVINQAYYIYKARPGSIRQGGLNDRQISSFFKLIDMCVNLKLQNLTISFMEEKIFWYCDSLQRVLNGIDKEARKVYLADMYRFVPFQNVNFSDFRGVIIKKIIYNSKYFLFK